jgi:hypothetical protein
MFHKAQDLQSLLPSPLVREHAEDRGMLVNDYYSEASRILKAELVRRDINYQDLADLLGDETYGQLKTKINRGSFSAGFFIRVMRAIGAEQLDLRQISMPRARMK